MNGATQAELKALSFLLTAYMDERNRTEATAPIEPSRFTIVTMDEIMSRDDSWLTLVAEKPALGALELALQELGKRLFKRGGIEAMHNALEHVAQHGAYGARASCLDHRWNGIGDAWWS